MRNRKFDSDRKVTFPQTGERLPNGDKLPKSERHKNLKSMYRLMGKSKKPWQCKLYRVV